MQLFYALIKLSFRRQLTYRTANLAGLATNFFFGLLRASIMIALYGERIDVAGYSLQDAITFTGVSQATIACLSFFGWTEVMQSVYSGDVASDLLKPMGYFSFWLAQDLGRAIASLLVRSVTLMLAYALFYDITLPRSAGQWLAVAVALILGILLSFSWRFLTNLAAFWTPDARGIIRLVFVFAWFMSGFLMPLRFFPEWFTNLCHLTPFPAMINTLIEVYLGVLTGPAMFQAMGMQLLWIALLFTTGQLVLRAGVRRLVIQGG